MLVLVVGPSGAGKDTLMAGARLALAGDTRVRFVRREITRTAEAGGEDHIGIDVSTFAQRRAAGAYALSWEAHGLGYGVPADIEGDVAAGRLVIVNVSRGVIGDAASRFPLLVLEITAPAQALARRLAARGRETAEDIALRLARRVDVPAGVEVVTVMNDGTVADGVAQVVAALLERVVPDTSLTMRSAVAEDEPDVVALWRACDLVAPYNDPVADFRFAKAGSCSDVLVAVDEAGAVMGSVMVGHDGHRGWLYYVAAHPASRGRGVGACVVRAAEEWLRALGVVKVQLLVRETNTKVVSFYERLGFEVAPRVVMSRWLWKEP